MKNDRWNEWNPTETRCNCTHIWQSRLLATIRRDKESYFVLLKGTINQEDIKIVNTYVAHPNL
jgi:hypothetical protein